MGVHVHMIEDENGDVVDIEYFCSQWCANEAGIPQPSAWPGGMETDYSVYCTQCGTLMWEGLESDV